MNKCILFVPLLACLDQPTERTAVSQNDVGIASYQTERAEVNGNRVFTLRAFDSNERQLASLRLTTGSIDDIRTFLPGTDLEGSEILITMNGRRDTRLLTRETHHFHVGSESLLTDATVAHFLELPEIATALVNEGQLVGPKAPKVSIADRPLLTTACPSEYLLTSPTAQQCCFSYGDTQEGTLFIRPDDRAMVWRERSWGGQGCINWDGGSCNGSDCTFGPNGFRRPYINTWVDYNQYDLIYTDDHDPWSYDPRYAYVCEYRQWEWDQPHEFADLNGSFPRDQGCPNGDDGNGDWDY